MVHLLRCAVWGLQDQDEVLEGVGVQVCEGVSRTKMKSCRGWGCKCVRGQVYACVRGGEVYACVPWISQKSCTQAQVT